MSAPDSESFDHGAYDLARRTHVTDVANREDEIRTHYAGGHRPLGALGLKTQLRDLGDHVFAHPTEYEQMDALFDLRLRKRTTQRAQTRLGERRPLDPSQQGGA